MSNDTFRNSAGGNVTADGNYPRDDGVTVNGPYVVFAVTAYSGTAGTFTPQWYDPSKAGWVNLDNEGTDVTHTSKNSNVFTLPGTSRVRYVVTLANSLDADYLIKGS